MDYGARAKELFESGYNCSQAVFLACTEDSELDTETKAKLASSFGGGIGGMRQVCGTLSGMYLALGLRYGYSDPRDKAGKAAQYELIRALADEFKQENGSIICRELLGLDENFKPKPPEARTDSYYKKRPCGELCKCAADILGRYMDTHPAAEK